MTYNNDSHIKSVEDVKAFLHHLVTERKLNFHPDDDFASAAKITGQVTIPPVLSDVNMKDLIVDNEELEKF